MTPETPGALWGVMPTFRRPRQLLRTLDALAEQTQRLDHLVIVDNGGDVRARHGAAVEAHRAAARSVTILTQSENLGPAGALDVALRHVLTHGEAHDWVVTLDDDDPPQFADTLARLCETMRLLIAVDPRCGAVGFGGSAFLRRSVRTRRLHNSELTGAPVPVDMISGNHMPLVRCSAIRAVGTYDPRLFFGLDDLEFFLRMRRQGWNVYCDSALARRHRDARGRVGARTVPSRRLGPADWRRYYSVRNHVSIAVRYAGVLPTVGLISTLVAKVMLNLFVDPKAAAAHARLTLRACAEGLVGRLGPTWQPPLTADGELASDNGRSVRWHAEAGTDG